METAWDKKDRRTDFFNDWRARVCFLVITGRFVVYG